MINDTISKCMNIILTNKCNADCCYCDFPSLTNTNSITANDLNLIDNYTEYCIKKILLIHYNTCIIFLGGEIGLLDRTLLEKLTDICNKHMKNYNIDFIHWMTNGLLFDTYPDIIKDASFTFSHHILENDFNDFNPILADNITYNIVITKQNENDVVKFINKHPNIKIRVKPCNDIRNGYESYFLKENKKLEYKYKRKLFNNFECNNKSQYFALDYTNYTLFKCCRSYTSFERKDLNIENLDLAFAGKLFNKSDLCKKCFMCDHYE